MAQARVGNDRWLRQQWLMLALAGLVALYVFQATDLDRWVAGWFFDAARGVFPLREHWLFEDVLHKATKRITYLAVGTAMFVCWLGWRGRLRWLPRRNALLAAAGMIVIPLTITMLKLATGRHCPWDMTDFGGSVAYLRLLEALPAGVKPGQCFPAGHASTGYLWIVWAIALRPAGLRWARLGLAAGLVLGGLLGVARLVQGAHFLSHTVATLWVAWAVSLLLAAALKADVGLGAARPPTTG